MFFSKLVRDVAFQVDLHRFVRLNAYLGVVGNSRQPLNCARARCMYVQVDC